MRAKVKRRSIAITDKQWKNLVAEAKRRDLSVCQIIRELIKNHQSN